MLELEKIKIIADYIIFYVHKAPSKLQIHF